MRLTPYWIEEARSMLAAPVLERLRFLESITPDPHISAAEIGEALHIGDPDAHGLAQAMGHLIPASRFFAVLGNLAGIQAVTIPEYLQAFWLGAALHEFEKPSSPFLRQAIAAVRHEWWDGNRETVLPLIPRVAGLAEHSDPEVAYPAAVMALAANVLSPAVVSVLRRRLHELPDLLARRKAGDEEVGELERAELFWGIAKAGEALRELAADLLLHPDNSLYAAVVAVGVNAQSLAPAIEKLYHDTPATPPQHLRSAEKFPLVRARCYYAYATWYLSGPDSRFHEAVSLVGDNLIARAHLVKLLRVSAPTPRVREALLLLAQEDHWQADVLKTFQGFGPAAATSVAGLTPPELSSPAYAAYVEACWRCDLRDTATARRAIEQKLAAHNWGVWDDHDSGLSEAWEFYLKLEPDPERIRSALTILDPQDVHPLEALAHPQHGLRLLPVIHQTGHAGLVEALWRQCADKSSFWSALDL